MSIMLMTNPSFQANTNGSGGGRRHQPAGELKGDMPGTPTLLGPLDEELMMMELPSGVNVAIIDGL